MEKNRLLWACRRGMLELDIILGQFVAHRYDTVSAEAQAEFEALLSCQDQDLFSWLVHKVPPEPQYQRAIAMILES